MKNQYHDRNDDATQLDSQVAEEKKEERMRIKRNLPTAEEQESDSDNDIFNNSSSPVIIKRTRHLDSTIINNVKSNDINNDNDKNNGNEDEDEDNNNENKDKNEIQSSSYTEKKIYSSIRNRMIIDSDED